MLEPIDPASLDEILLSVRQSGAEVAAVCLLHSYVNPAHEREVAPRLRRAGRAGVGVVRSAARVPRVRAVEHDRRERLRVAADRPVPGAPRGRPSRPPPVDHAVERRVDLRGLARAEAVRTVLSGPAAGVVGARAVAADAGLERIISFDMGGTSTDVSLVDEAIPTSTESRIGDFPVRLPVIDIHTVGAGGGSIAFVDSGGALRVGPRAAGAVPGPVCYGAGAELTVTDANLLLGRLDPEFFLGGRMPLDVGAHRVHRHRDGARVEAAASTNWPKASCASPTPTWSARFASCPSNAGTIRGDSRSWPSAAPAACTRARSPDARDRHRDRPATRRGAVRAGDARRRRDPRLFRQRAAAERPGAARANSRRDSRHSRTAPSANCRRKASRLDAS